MIVTRNIYRVFKPQAWEQTFKFNSNQTGIFYLEMKDKNYIDSTSNEPYNILVQGANPFNAVTLAQEKDFQGGYRCTLKVVTQPNFGSVKVLPLGFLYTSVSPVWMGNDSFSYSVVNPMGYESDARCIFVSIGLGSIYAL